MDDDACIVVCHTDRYRSEKDKQEELKKEITARTNADEFSADEVQKTKQVKTKVVLPWHDQKAKNEKRGENTIMCILPHFTYLYFFTIL